MSLLQWLFEYYPEDELQQKIFDTQQNSVLHVLVKSNVKTLKQNLGILKLLLEHGCSPHLRDASGRKPVEYVSENSVLYPLLSLATLSKSTGTLTFCLILIHFSSPELKTQVSYSDRLLSVVRLSVCKFLFSTSSREPCGQF
jgi:hypothetical protein